MKTEKKKTEKSAIEQLRKIRDEISDETKDMTFEQLKKYVEERLTLHHASVWRKHAESAK